LKREAIISDEEENLEEFCQVTCCSCGILFGFPKRVQKEWRRTDNGFYCPNGHPLAWNKPTETDESKKLKKLRVEVKELKTKLESAQTKADTQEKKVAELTAELEIWQPSSVFDKKSNGTDKIRSGD
jgi:hypothetical protein